MSQLLITGDRGNSSNNQSCTNAYDDLARVSQNSCDHWGQTFVYDAFGNIVMEGFNGGLGFWPQYDSSTNHIDGPGYFHYDSMGNLTADGTYTYSYDAEGRPTVINGKQIHYDALGREAGIGPNAPILYSPTGDKIAVFNNGTLQTYLIPLVAGTKLQYDGKGAINLQEADWQGSSRLGKGWNANVLYDRAYSPHGEAYAEQGNTTGRSFAGATEDMDPGFYDFLFRQQDTYQGRWVVPDPAGLSAVNITDPQTWNRYAYVANRPLNNTDSLGLDEDSCEDDGSCDGVRGGDLGLDGGYCGDYECGGFTGSNGGGGPSGGGDDGCAYDVCVVAPPPDDVSTEEGPLPNPIPDDSDEYQIFIFSVNSYCHCGPYPDTQSAYAQAATQAIAKDVNLFPTLCTPGVGATAKVGTWGVNYNYDFGEGGEITPSIEPGNVAIEPSGNVSLNVGEGVGGTVTVNPVNHTVTSVGAYAGFESKGVEVNVNVHASVTSIGDCHD